MRAPIQLTALALAAAALTACQSSEQSINYVDYGDNHMENPQFMADMMAAGTPGEEHAELAKLVGTWKVSGHFLMAPDAEPWPTTANATVRTILGGRYIVEDYNSDFMGTPFNGMLIQGYNNVTEKYFTIWMDNMSTGATMSFGTEDENGVMTAKGTAYDIITPEGRPMRTVITEKSENEYVMDMYDHTPEGEEFRSMHLVYTR